LNRILGFDELDRGLFFVKSVISIFVTFSLSFTFFWMEDSCFGIWSCVGEFLKDRAGVKEFGIKFLGSFESSADDENFSGYISIIRDMKLDLGEPGSGRFSGFNFSEKLIEYPD
jgi:hypothetical protein